MHFSWKTARRYYLIPLVLSERIADCFQITLCVCVRARARISVTSVQRRFLDTLVVIV
jgi:hypothetical protein